MRPTRGVLAEIAGFTSTAELFAATVGDRTADPQVPGNGERFLGPRWPVRTSELTTVVLAPNPGPMTLEGTNSYLIGRTGAPSVVVVDPGPQDQVHLRSLTAHGRVELILITHRHVDHTAGSAELHRLTGAPVRALDPEYCHGGPPLRDGERITAAGIDIEVIATPGHSSDSVCFRLPDDRSLRAATGTPGSGVVLTGDTILGRGTTVLAFPDGSLTDYFRSLNTLIGLGSALVLPAHGPTLPDLAAIASGYLTHRHERLDQVRAALAQESLPRTGAGGDPVADLVDAVTAVVYAAVPQNVQFAARKSVAAQIDHLIRTGELPDPGENPAAAPDPRRPGPMDVPRQTDPHAAEPTR
ncbi:MBL fold metallo-hydrolase [Nakamurella silvestris]|nr:MBL fold metallo-hydrolase [Nakamurella silvestris]